MTELELAQQFAAHLDQGDLMEWAATLPGPQLQQVGGWIADYLEQVLIALTHDERIPFSAPQEIP